MRWLFLLLFLPVFGFGQWPVKNINVDGSNVVTKDVEGNVVVGRNLTVNDTVLTLNHGNSSQWVQTISTDGTAGDVSIENGNSITLNVNDNDADATNELNTSLNWNDATNELSITDAGSTLTEEITGFVSNDATVTLTGDVTGTGLLNIETDIASDSVRYYMFNDDVISGQTETTYVIKDDELLVSDGGLLRKMSLTTLSNYIDPYTGWQLSSEGGASTLIGEGETVNFTGTGLATVTRSTNTIDIDVSGDGTGSDDQNISGSGLSGSDLTIGIENGTSETVDLSSVDYGSWNLTGDGSGSTITSGYTVNLIDSDNITINKTLGATSQDIQFDWGAAIGELSDVTIGGQGSPSLTTGHLLQYDGHYWINAPVTDVLTAIPVKDIIVSDNTISGNGSYQNIYDTYITDTRQSGVTYEIDLLGGWTFDGSASIELRWYNDDQTGWTELGTYSLSGSSASDVTVSIKLKTTLRSGSDATGYTTYTYLEMEDQDGNKWMLRRNDSVSSALTGAGEDIRLRVEINLTSDEYFSVEQGETKLLRE